jgi:UDP-N-acetyl-2-amino-2-deoxyglucuronate dehydrogenase
MLKFALIGCGRIAERHSILLGSNQIQNAKLVSVCDISLKKAKKIATKFNISAYSDVNEMLKSETIDVAVVLTPSGDHAENVINLSSKVKYIIVEKPLALNIQDAEKMINECKKKNVKLFVVKQNRFNLPVIKLKEALDKGRFGKLTLGTVRVRWARHQSYFDLDSWRGTWNMDGGVLANQASHHIDMLLWMMGDVESVFAKTTTSLVNIESENTAVATLKFKNGALGIVEATTATRPKNLEGSLSILGEKGTAVIGGIAVNKLQTWVFDDDQPDNTDVLNKFSENPPDVYGFGHKAYYDYVVECLIHKKNYNKLDGSQGLKSVELISAIYESTLLEKEIFLDTQSRNIRLGETK